MNDVLARWIIIPSWVIDSDTFKMSPLHGVRIRDFYSNNLKICFMFPKSLGNLLSKKISINQHNHLKRCENLQRRLSFKSNEGFWKFQRFRHFSCSGSAWQSRWIQGFPSVTKQLLSSKKSVLAFSLFFGKVRQLWCLNLWNSLTFSSKCCFFSILRGHTPKML